MFHQGGNIGFRTDDWQNLGGITLGDTFQLGFRIVTRVNFDPTFGSTIRQIEQGYLPGHQHRQSTNLVNVNARGESDPSFGWVASQRVLYSISSQ